MASEFERSEEAERILAGDLDSVIAALRAVCPGVRAGVLDVLATAVDHARDPAIEAYDGLAYLPPTREASGGFDVTSRTIQFKFNR